MKKIYILLLLLSLTLCEQKKALIFGVTGQDGSYLAELLLKKGYQVHGTKRRSSSFNTERINHIYQNPHAKKQKFSLHYVDLSDSMSVLNVIKKTRPHEIYNLAAQSHVKVSFDMPEYTADIVALGALRILEAIRILGLEKHTKYYQASSSEMFGKVQEPLQGESTPFYPRSPYAVSKLFAHFITINYRESYNMFACSGILFNHESPRRGGTFVTKKITDAALKIKNKKQKVLYLGNLESKRDWGYAKDYVEAMWLMLQQEEPQDFVIGTGKTQTVRSFVEKSFKTLGIEIQWEGAGLNEVGFNKATGKRIVKIDRRYFRPAEVDLLIANPAKAKKILNFTPKTTIDELIKIMLFEKPPKRLAH
jgi:GDPmannose 4,6-dehydratase